MRPVFVMWLQVHGLPGFLVPDYATMCGLAALLGGYIGLRLAARDGCKVHIQARAFALAYLAALLGGYVFEWIRAIPDAIRESSFEPIITTGRAAYGGLLGGILVPSLYLRWQARREGQAPSWLPARAFLDRATPGMGISFALVRAGCFLEGCDFGKPTGGPLGVRFPAGSLAADDHFMRGWIPAGAPSLPVHATELYESLVGVVASLVAWQWLRHKDRPTGAAFLAWIVTYASGRFALEMLRGDADRGLYLGLSSAQFVSIGLVVAAFVLARRWKLPLFAFSRSRAMLASAAAALMVTWLAPASAHAQPRPAPGAANATPDALVLKTGERLTGTIVESVPGDHISIRLPSGQVSFIAWMFVDKIERAGKVDVVQPPPPPPPSGYVTITPGQQQALPPPPPGFVYATQQPMQPPDQPAAPPKPVDTRSVQYERLVTARINLAPSFTLLRPEVPSGFATEVDVLYRLRLGRSSRFDLGLEGRVFGNDVAYHYGLGVPLILVGEFGRHFEMHAAFVPTHTWINFDTDAFLNTNVWAMRLEGELTWVASSRVSFGFSPVAFNVISAVSVGVITSYEPRIAFALSF
jgi:phosphatidylglycerol:prolipoprotein diacylglycerol transferase